MTGPSRTRTERATGRRLELYVQSLSPSAARERQEAAIRVLETLVGAGTVDGYRLVVWGDEVCPDSTAASTPTGRLVLDRVSRFREWVAANDASLRGVIERDEGRSLVSESREVIRLPLLLLAEYRNGELVDVAPRREGSTHIGVIDRLATLARSTPEFDAGQLPDTAEP